MKSRRVPILPAALLIAAATVARGLGAGEGGPVFQFDGVPVRFVDTITNKYFPLLPGTKFFYRGFDGRAHTSDVMYVSYNKKRILGVECTVVRDEAFVEGVLAELTLDWYAQDAAGNVWYFGEDTKEFDAEGSVISTEGSWEAGVDDARPGIIMKAKPAPGDRYLQELAPGVAEDAAEVHSIKPGCVPYGCFEELLAINEWTRLNPDVLDRKLYAKGVGFVAEQMLRGGSEYLALVYVTTQPPPDAP